MSESVMGWLFGWWDFGRASDGRGEASRRRIARTSAAAPVDAEIDRQPVILIDGTPLVDLLTAIRAGDRNAFAALYGHSFRSLWTVAMMQLHSAALAEDVVQDVFLWLWTHPGVIVPDRDIRAYLATAVRKRASNIRKHQRVHDTVEHAVNDATVDPPAMGQPVATADALAEQSDLRRAYITVLSTLSERERLAALLRWEEGMTFEEIGQVLSLGLTGARKVVLRAQQKVQGALEQFRNSAK